MWGDIELPYVNYCHITMKEWWNSSDFLWKKKWPLLTFELDLKKHFYKMKFPNSGWPGFALSLGEANTLGTAQHIPV